MSENEGGGWVPVLPGQDRTTELRSGSSAITPDTSQPKPTDQLMPYHPSQISSPPCPVAGRPESPSRSYPHSPLQLVSLGASPSSLSSSLSEHPCDSEAEGEVLSDFDRDESEDPQQREARERQEREREEQEAKEERERQDRERLYADFVAGGFVGGAGGGGGGAGAGAGGAGGVGAVGGSMADPRLRRKPLRHINPELLRLKFADPQEGVKIKNRTWHFRVFKECFIGSFFFPPFHFHFHFHPYSFQRLP